MLLAAKFLGDNLEQLIDNYCSLYSVPAHVRNKMHRIRLSQSSGSSRVQSEFERTAASTTAELHVTTMQAYQYYYYRQKNKPQRQASYTIYFDGHQSGAQKVKRNAQGKHIPQQPQQQ